MVNPCDKRRGGIEKIRGVTAGETRVRRVRLCPRVHKTSPDQVCKGQERSGLGRVGVVVADEDDWQRGIRRAAQELIRLGEPMEGAGRLQVGVDEPERPPVHYRVNRGPTPCERYGAGNCRKS